MFLEGKKKKKELTRSEAQARQSQGFEHSHGERYQTSKSSVDEFASSFELAFFLTLCPLSFVNLL